MKCPECGSESGVTDSRYTEEKDAIRRRRKCLENSHRFTTYESWEIDPKSYELVRQINSLPDEQKDLFVKFVRSLVSD